MKSLFAFLNISLLVGFVANARTDAFYVTQGQVVTAPQIDALVWTNRDTFNVFTFPAPFETQNTTRFVNLGIIDGSPGLRFETIDDSGNRSAANDFLNKGEIRSSFSRHSSTLGGVVGDPFHELYGGLISIWATNITSRGFITGGFAGDISIRGNNVDLSRGGIGNSVIDVTSFDVWAGHGIDTGSSFRSGSGYPLTQTDFMPEIGFQDLWWGYGETGIGFRAIAGRGTTNVATVLGETPAVIGVGGVGFDIITTGGAGRAGISGGLYRSFVNKNQIETNVQVFEVAFVRVPDTNVVVDVSWEPGFDPNLPIGTAFIRMSAFETNAVTGSPAINQIIFVDTSATQRQEIFLRNIVTLNTFSPTNLFAVRASGMDPNAPLGSLPTNSVFFASGVTNLFTHWIDDQVFTNYMQMTNSASTNGYMTWAGTVDWLPSRPIGKSTGSGFFLGNLFGNGGFGDGVKGANWTNVAGRVSIDADNLNLNNSRIQGQGVVSIKSRNLQGASNSVINAPFLSLDLSSASNDLKVANIASGWASHLGGQFRMFSTVISNSFNYTFTNAATDPTATPTTTDAVYNVVYHVTILDTTFQTLRGQVVEDVKLSSDRVTIDDQLVVERDFLVDAETVVVNNQLARSSGQDIDATSFPRLNNLTVNGLLATDNSIRLGASDSPLDSLANQGSIEAAAVQIFAKQFTNNAQLFAGQGQLSLGGDSLVGDGGVFAGQYGLSLAFKELNLKNATLGASYGEINLSADSVQFENTEISVTRGLTLHEVPAIGDFNGAKLICQIPDFEETIIVWPGADLGATPLGFLGNASVGELELLKGRLSGLRIEGHTDSNALYVRFLNISDAVLADLESYLAIAPNMVVYFSSVSPNIAPEVLETIPLSGGGKLVYVPSDPLGSTISAKVGLSADRKVVEVTWSGLQGTSYEVQSKTVVGGTWTKRQVFQNDQNVKQVLKFQDPISTANGVLYRVIAR